MIKLLLTVLLLLVACGPARVALPSTVAISSDFSASDTNVILDALDTWRSATNGRANLIPRISDEATVQIKQANLAVLIGETCVNQNDTASINISLVHVDAEAIRDGIEHDAMLKCAVMHELGHAFGLNHVPDTLMRPVGFCGTEVDPDTLRRFREAND